MDISTVAGCGYLLADLVLTLILLFGMDAIPFVGKLAGCGFQTRGHKVPVSRIKPPR